MQKFDPLKVSSIISFALLNSDLFFFQWHLKPMEPLKDGIPTSNNQVGDRASMGLILAANLTARNIYMGRILFLKKNKDTKLKCSSLSIYYQILYDLNYILKYFLF